jgi:hypothetical protein
MIMMQVKIAANSMFGLPIIKMASDMESARKIVRSNTRDRKSFSISVQ